MYYPQIQKRLAAHRASSRGGLRVLFITNSSLGDTVLGLGPLEAVLEAVLAQPLAPETTGAPGGGRQGTAGQVELFIATPDKVRPLFEDHPHLVDIFSFDRQKHARHWHELIKWARKRRFDLVYDSRRSPFSRVLKAPLRMTPQLDRQRVLDKRHKLAQNAGVASLQEAPRPRIHLAPARLARFADLPRPAFVLAPKSNWAPKDWSLHNYIALVRAVLAQPELKACHFYLLGLQTQAAACQGLVEAIPPAQCHPMFGTHGLLDVASLCRGADLFLGSDSGLLHMAHCVACPTIGLYAVADDRVYGPWHAGSYALRGRPTPPEGEKKARPEAHKAMQALGLDPVLTCVKAQLTQNGPRASLHHHDHHYNHDFEKRAGLLLNF